MRGTWMARQHVEQPVHTTASYMSRFGLRLKLQLLQDPDIKSKVLWEGMAVIRPWDNIPAEVLAVEPHIYEDVAIRSGELDEEQKEVLQVSS